MAVPGAVVVILDRSSSRIEAWNTIANSAIVVASASAILKSATKNVVSADFAFSLVTSMAAVCAVSSMMYVGTVGHYASDRSGMSSNAGPKQQVCDNYVLDLMEIVEDMEVYGYIRNMLDVNR
jgi:hypothetical protein